MQVISVAQHFNAVSQGGKDARGRFGWWGSFGTAFWCDPATDTIAVLFTQRMMAGPDDTEIFGAFLGEAFTPRTQRPKNLFTE